MPRSEQYLKRKKARRQRRRERWAKIKKVKWELALNGIILLGWVFLTVGIQALTHRPWIVWPIAVGILLWGYAGFGYIITFFWRGFYVNMKMPPHRTEGETL